jgi:hypothetical protein
MISSANFFVVVFININDVSEYNLRTENEVSSEKCKIEKYSIQFKRYFIFETNGFIKESLLTCLVSK